MRQRIKGRARYRRTGDPQSQVELGRLLFVEKQYCFKRGDIWKTYVREAFNLSRERADELIRIGKGVATVEQMRAQKRYNTRLWRERQIELSEILRCIEKSTKAYNQARGCVNKTGCKYVDRNTIKESLIRTIEDWKALLDLIEKKCK